jgi:TonB family protein
MRTLGLAMLVLGCAGCVSAQRAAPPAARPVMPKTDAAHGAVGMRFIADPSGEPPKLTDHQEFVAAQMVGPPVLPVYPAQALAASAPPFLVAVRITIDKDGKVTKIEDSPVLASSTGPFAGEFRAAVDDAVRRWRFSGGYIDQVEDGKDLDGDGKPDYTTLVERDPVDVLYDVRFDFEIVRGEGKVRSSATKP